MIHNRRLALIAILAPCLFLPACGKPMDLGQWNNGTYTNQYFTFTIDAPDDWEPASRAEIRRMSKVGAEAMAVNDAELAKALEKGDIASYQLFMFSEYPLGPTEEFNHNMVCSMDRVPSRVKTPADFQREMKKLMRRMRIKIVNPGEAVTCGSNTFQMMSGTFKVRGVEVNQEYYSYMKNGYALTFILSFDDGHPSYDTLKTALGSVTFFE